MTTLSTTARDCPRKRRHSPSWIDSCKPTTTALLWMAMLLLLLQSSVTSAAENVDAETGGKCFDADPKNCPFWAATGECESNKEVMHTQCKKSCNRCHVVRVKDQNEINQFIAQKQSEFDRKRRQRKEEKEMMKILQGGGSETETGKNGNADDSATPLPTTTTTTTKHKSDGKPNVVSKGSSNTGSNSLGSKQPPKTTTPPQKRANNNTDKKKKTKTNAETGSECTDQDRSGNCPFWAAEGECNANRTWMHTNCKLSCDRCHIVRVNNQRDIGRFIANKNKESTKDIERQRKAREAIRVLQSSGSIGSGGDEL